MKPILHFLAILLWPFMFSFVQAQTPEPAPLPSFFDFLYAQQDSMPVLELKTDWSKLVRKKMDMEYQSAVLGFTHEDGRNIALDVQIKARGNMRKQVCFYPPLKVKLPKKQLGALGFSNYNDLKMVLQCRTGSRDEEWIVKEWFIYQLYECISPAALRTQLVRINAVQDEKARGALYAFLLEYEDEMAARLKAKVVKQGVVGFGVLDRDAYVKMCFFQYMIANTDWSVPNRHNLEFIMTPPQTSIVPIAYDFDYSGLINTSYAVPYEALPIKSVTDRHFLGVNVTLEEAMEARRHFLSKKEEVMQRCHNFNLLEERSKKMLVRFISDFFDIIQDEKFVKRTFVTAR
ncbi:MAG: hypothetical protein KF852_10630 [Saprospiraceae bacterium]|nr:hypothetical protein [Saprospiraceae bacterium]